MTSRHSALVYRFASYELDPARLELKKSGVRVRLSGKPLEALLALLERPGDIVTREDLLKRLWGADTFVEFEDSLNHAIRRVREALDDDPKSARFIETVPRAGYRFLAGVQKSEREQAPPEAGAVNPGPTQLDSRGGTSVSGRRIRFDAFEADLTARELRRQGVRLKLQDQPFQVLAALLEKPGQVVTREELRQRIWGDDIFVDFDKSLSAAVNKVRLALDDSRTRPRFIETIPKVGYRFIGAIDRELDSPVLDSPATGGPAAGSRITWGARRIGWIAAAGLSALVVWAFWGFRSQTDSLPPAAGMLKSVPLTSYPGAEVHPSFSPDSSRIAFAWNGENEEQYDIYVRLIGPGRLLQITQDPGDDVSPAWSPDGRWIAFLRRPPRSSSQLSGSITSAWGRIASVFVVPALGGVERKLGEIRTAGFDTGPYMYWSHDGTALILPDRPLETEPYGLFALEFKSGEKRRLTFSPSYDGSPAVSPDGRLLAFSRSGLGFRSEIYVLPISAGLEPTGQARRLTFEGQWALSPTWTLDGREVVFSGGSWVGGRALWRVPVSSRHKPRLVVLPAEIASTPTLALGAARLAYVEESPDRNIRRMFLPGLRDSAGPPEILISSTRSEKQPQFSPDGRRIAFVSNRSGSEEIWVCDSDGSSAVQLTSFDGPPTDAPRWSPDGERIAFGAFLRGSGEIYVISSAGGAATRLTSDSHYDVTPSWSHDGQWIYFASDRSGTRQIWKMPANQSLPPRAAVQVTRKGGNYAPFESVDGEFVFYIKGSRQPTTASEGSRFRQDLWRVPRDGGEEIRVLEGIARGGGYAPTRDGIYFLSRTATTGAFALKFWAFAGGEIRLVNSFRKTVNHLAVSPDQRQILYLEDSGSADLMLVEGFQ